MPKKAIPQDRFHSGHRDSDCWAVVYGATKMEVRKKVDAYFRNYPPQGYSTTASPIVKHLARYYFCRLQRRHSCD